MRLGVLVLVAGCLEPGDTLCGELVCPASMTCDQIHGGCIRPDQLTSCEDKQSDDSCPLESGTTGRCDRGVCVPLYCGDGRLDGAEQCDGEMLTMSDCTDLGYHVSGPLACTATCTLDASACTQLCGDGVVDPVEQCDGDALGAATNCTDLGYYEPGPLGCTKLCRYNVSDCHGECGDHVVDDPEYCEDVIAPGQSCAQLGYDRGQLACTARCTPELAGCRRIGWDAVPVATTAELRGIWERSPNDVFAVGVGGTIVHFDGTAWSPMASGTTFDLNAVWGTATDVYAVGQDSDPNGLRGVVLRYDGVTWSPFGPAQEPGRLVAVWASEPNDVYATGEYAWHFDGTTWSKLFSGTGSSDPYVGRATTWGYQAVWGTAGDNVYIGFSDNNTPRVLRFNGTSWSTAYILPGGSTAHAIWGTAANDIWVVGDGGIVHYDGTWTPMSFPTGSSPVLLRAVAGTGRDDVFAFGVDGLVVHYDGVEWSRFPSPSSGHLWSSWARQRDHVVAVGAAGAFRYLGSAWAPTITTSYNLPAVTGTSPHDVMALEFGTVMHVLRFDGAAWAEQFVSSTVQAAQCAFATPTGAILIGGFGDVCSYNGGSCNALMSAGNELSYVDIWSSGPNDIYAIGRGNDPYTSVEFWNLAHYDGAWSWTALDVRGVGGTGANDVYLAGIGSDGHGTLLHGDGSGSWSPVAIPQVAPLASVSGRAANDIYAVGEAGTILHYDGVAWTKHESGTSVPLTRVWAVGPGDAFAVGRYGTILHRDGGTTWTPVRSGTTQSLRGVWGSRQSVFFSGDGGTLLELRRTAPW